MTKDEVEIVQSQYADRLVISIENLVNKSNRTLLYGYTCDRSDWHVYIYHGEIHILCGKDWDNNEGFHKIQYDYEPYEFVPSKRLYPECCDYEFCCLLRKHGCSLPFTTYNESRKPAQYYGDIK